MKLSKVIKDFRYINELSQQEFAKIVGCSQSAISGWENGTKLPSQEMREKIKNSFKRIGLKIDI